MKLFLRAALLVCLAAGFAAGAHAQTGPKPHKANLQWTAPTDFAAGDFYNVYRGTVSGGPYTIVSPGGVSTTVFTDLSVSAGGTYFYVVTHASATNESINSNEVKAVIPKDLSAPVNLTLTGVS